MRAGARLSRGLLTLLLPALIALVGLPASPATADPGDDLLTVQMQLIGAADRISAAMAGSTGLAGLTVEAAVPELRLYWKGPVPAQVRRAIRAEGTTRVSV